MHKKLYTLFLSGVAVASLVGCGSSDLASITGKEVNANTSVQNETSDIENKESETESTVETTGDTPSNGLTLTKAEQAGYDFIKAVQENDMATALSLTDIDTTFITVDDFSWYIPRSYYSELLNTNYEIDDVYSSYSTNISNSASYNVGNTEFDIDTILNNDNEWKVDFSSEYTSDYKIQVPSGVTITLNNVSVSSDYITDANSEYDVYTIPALIKRDTSLVMTSTVYGDYECTFLPSNDGDTYTAVFEITGTQRDELYSQTLDVINEVNDTYEAGQTELSDFSQFTSDKGTSDITTALFNSVEEAHRQSSTSTPQNVSFTTFVAISQEEATNLKTNICYLASNDTVVLNCKVEKTWTNTKLGEFLGNRLYGTVTVETTDDGIKIADMPASENIFTNMNYLTHEWD